MKSLVLFSIVLISPLIIHAKESASIIGTLDYKEYGKGVGCEFFLANDPHKLVVGDDLGGGRWIMVNNRALHFSGSLPADLPEKQGEKSEQKYSSGDVVAKLELEKTSDDNCSGEPCAGESFEGTLTVVSGKVKQSIPITGGCGD